MPVNGPLSTRLKSLTRPAFARTAPGGRESACAKKKPPFPAASIHSGPLLLRIQLVRYELEFGVEGRTDQVHRRDDHNRNASGDETVFDRGRAGLVLQKRNKL